MATKIVNAKLVGKVDVKKIAGAIAKRDRKVLFRTAGFARTTMMRGMRRRKKISKPGDYPSAHSGELRKLIRFDVGTTDAVVGPIKFNAPKNWTSASAQTLPELMQEGGGVVALLGTKQKPRKLNYQARPFVTLANQKAADRLAQNIRNIGFF